MNSNEIEQRNKEYNDYVKTVTPTHNIFKNIFNAFLTGGAICTIGQIIFNIANTKFNLNTELSGTWTSLILIVTSIILTSFNVFPSIAKWGGAGALVPITGFANGVAAAALEFKKEGQVFGIGCQIFKIAGPVILYGIFTSWCLGLLYWLFF